MSERRRSIDRDPDIHPHSDALPWTSLRRAAVSRHGMVSTSHYLATDIGARILEEGGNAIDAAVACAFALGVCEPAASGLGGQTMMLIRTGTGKKIALDGSSRAPWRAEPGMFVKKEVRRGHEASTVPSTPATLGYALGNYGTMPVERILAPVIDLAEEGFRVSPLLRRLTRRERKYLKQTPAAQFFLVDGRKSPPTGHRMRQPVLARTLRRLARRGIRDFYTGGIARDIVRDMKRGGGLIRADDLAQIPWPIERRPLSARFGSARVLTMPPPGAGRTLVEMLNIVSHLKPADVDPDTSRGALVLAEVIRRAFMDRRDRPFDPNFYQQVDEPRMLDLDYARTIARETRKKTRERLRGETTHLSVMDRHGGAVALTQSIESVYGACVASPELGFLYNNYMSAFEYEDIGHPYFLRPGAVPWASVAPTIVMRGRRPWLAIGSPGSERITPSILQVLLRIEQGESLYEAIDAPRLHCSLTGRVSLEADRMDPDTPGVLERAGFELDEREPYSFYLGCVQAVMRSDRRFHGAADPRRDGAAGGPRR
jgi:gamma-glutamyltranspeptidase/glutathione hydrolase